IAIYPPPPECYVVGAPSQAAVTIADGGTTGTNRPPIVSLFAPTNGSVFAQGTGILLQASAADPDGAVTRVEFRRGTQLLGSATSPSPLATNYAFLWSNAPLGEHTLTAIAVDNLNARGT